jgi:hypothetical protein
VGFFWDRLNTHQCSYVTRADRRVEGWLRRNGWAEGFVICFAGKKKILFYIYAVIVKQKFYKRSSNYYSGGQEIGLDPETSAPGRRHVPRGAPSLRSGWVIGTDRRMSEHPCAFDREKDFRTETKQWMHAEEGGGMERKEDY